MELNLSIPGRPISKKNHQQIVYVNNKPIIIQSKYWAAYEKFCIGGKRKPGWLMQWGNVQFKEPVTLTCRYWLPDRRSRPDLGNLLAGTCDLLEKAGILANDRLVAHFGDSCIIGIDKNNPRVEIEIKENA